MAWIRRGPSERDQVVIRRFLDGGGLNLEQLGQAIAQTLPEILEGDGNPYSDYIAHGYTSFLQVYEMDARAPVLEDLMQVRQLGGDLLAE